MAKPRNKKKRIARLLFKRTFYAVSFMFLFTWMASCSFNYITGADSPEIKKAVDESGTLVGDVITGISNYWDENKDSFKEQAGEAIRDTGETYKHIADLISDGIDSAKEIESKTEPEKEPLTPYEGEGTLTVHFVDVGQGDCTLVVFKGEDGKETTLLIDAGDNTKGTYVRNYIRKNCYGEIDYLVATHPDADHIGGMASVVSNVTVGSIFMDGFEKDTKTYDNLIGEINYKNMTYTIPVPGESYSLGDATFTFIAPGGSYPDVNDNSLVLYLEYGNTSFLFPGDASEAEEEEMLSSGYNLKCDVLKAGHHGSKHSSCKEFIDAVSPSYAVISCGEDNDYYHPHASALNNLRAAGAELFRTDIQGSIIATSDGNTITWNTPACNDWTSGSK